MDPVGVGAIVFQLCLAAFCLGRASGLRTADRLIEESTENVERLVLHNLRLIEENARLRGMEPLDSSDPSCECFEPFGEIGREFR